MNYVEIKNGLINGRHINYELKAWSVRIDQINQTIICHAEHKYKNSTEAAHFEFKLEDGTIGLSSGRVSKRHAYFKKREYQEFLNENGIDNVIRINPNGIWEQRDHFSSTVKMHKTRIKTDGLTKVTGKRNVLEKFYPDGNGPYDWEVSIKVARATWLIQVSYDLIENQKTTILYTEVEDVMGLNDSIRSHDYIDQKWYNVD